MRFRRIHIPAFGPFTNLELVFPGRGSDLHVIYGPNEAGKSSLLRAVRDLLFGMHGQSPDNFVHDYKKMRIAGEIVGRSGDRLIFQRRKGNKNTLLDADGNPLPDDALVPFLGSVDHAYFSTMFGLGARELHEGAEQLLRGEGDMGQALFSASMGGTPVQLVLAALNAESERLFKGRATANVSIRPTVNAHKELLRKSREAVVNAETWEKVERDLAAAEEDRARLECGISAIVRELEWLHRCEDALPTVGRLNEEMRKLEKLPFLPDVSSDFVERARAARKAAGEGHAELKRLQSQIARLQEQLAACRTSPAVLAEADSLDRLHRDLGAYQERRNTLTDLETELVGLEAALRAGMENLGLAGPFEALEPLRLSSALRLGCEEAADQLQKTRDAREKNAEKAEDLKAQIRALEKQLQTLPETDLTPLREVLAVAAGAAEADRTLAAGASEIQRLVRAVQDRHRELLGAPNDLDATGSLPVPSRATIRHFRDAMDGIAREIQGEELKIMEGKRQIEAFQAELNRLERLGELPSDEALRKARVHRDRGWSLVLADWKGGGSPEVFVPGVPLEEAFPQAVARADNLADQLRRQAEAVAQAEEKRFQMAQSEKQTGEAEQRIAALQMRLKECQTAWEEAWQSCGLTPGTPAEMEEWREAWSEFRELLRQLRVAEDALRQKSGQVQEAGKQLAAALSESAEKEFALLLEKVRQRVQEGEQAAGQRKEVIRQLRKLKNQEELMEQGTARLSAAVDTALEKWESQCRTVGLPEGISPGAGLALLQERKELLAKFDRWKDISGKARKTRDAVVQYEQAVREKATALGAGGETATVQESQLWKMLAEAREAQTRHEQLAAQIEEAGAALEESRTSYSLAVAALEEMLRLVKLDTVEALEPLLAHLELRDSAQNQIAAFRSTLSGLARGEAVDDFLDRVMSEDVDGLSRRIESLKARKAEKENALRSVLDAVYGLKAHKQALESAGDAAADYRQQAESCVARLKQDASHFIRLRLAAHFLQTQIERFRKENQGPLLEKSGQIFQNITRGAFSGLRADFNADDVPILVGMRPDQSSVPIGGMSDGSRDQLYLALRLAALDRYLDRHEPMPLILDDLLITFDDDRATAILPELAGLARRTQVFLFTHHDHLVELCRKTLHEEAFHLHRLNTASSGLNAG
ncbi:YhaN family protein [Desulforhabdus sp. TSK]|uniref:YhaN family protein n=1 Tax=Desulforhabdus sp. TSK TaxID=2925014 RepID=UPI001FC85176|nr:YhaN family protein [Desulforhabdus sp. TSK]GKT09474.1 hypothetical protein DSTSK_27790 [Desulforhabdus sp. TSK]